MLALFAPARSIQAAEAAEADEDMPDSLRIRPISPTNTLYGTRGLSQTPSAEALGANRLVLGLSSPWYRQTRTFPGVPNRHADIITGIGTIAYGLAPFVDIFASLTGYSSLNYRSSEASGLGTVGAGAQISWPLPGGIPVGLAAQASVFSGLSKNPINSNAADAYSYFETRTKSDFRGLLIQSLVLGPERMGFKAHFNEGLATASGETGNLLLLAAGLQANYRAAALGLELHSRTRADNVGFLDDPLWITPSLQLRTGWNVNLTAGTDVSLSRTRDLSSARRSLEPWRLFGGIAYTVDTQWKRTRDLKWSALKAERAQAAAVAQERRTSDSLEAMRRAQAAEQERLAMERRMQDSLQAEESRGSAAQENQDSLRARQERLAREGETAAERRRSPLETRLLAGDTVSLDSVPFGPGRSALAPEARPFLDGLARILVRYPKLRYEVGGHTDSIGTAGANHALSLARARAVKSYLAAREAALAARITAVGYGEGKPVADNATEEGRAANRRADLKVTNKDALEEYAAPSPQARGPEEP
jgi:outer membrane protein OmpA-like peptidoglycan-associated protein